MWTVEACPHAVNHACMLLVMLPVGMLRPAGWFRLAAEGASSEERDALAGPSEYSDRVAEAVHRTVLQVPSLPQCLAPVLTPYRAC